MNNVVIWQYGVFVAIFLLIANIVVFLGQENKQLTGKTKPISEAGFTKIPHWLKQEPYAATHIDLFGDSYSYSDNDKLLPPAAEKSVVKDTVDQNVQMSQEMPGKIKLNEDSVDKTIKVLAISRSGLGVSGMVEIEGKIYVVFPGDIIENQYLVRSITENQIFFDHQ